MSDDITLTDADALADLNGSPRPDNPTVQMIALPVIQQPRPAYQERVIAEHAELSERTQKLDTFTGSEAFRTVDTHEQARMVRQLNHMRGYRNVLAERIAAF
jgi:hypothetical protein